MATNTEKRITQIEQELSAIRNIIQAKGSNPKLVARRNQLQSELDKLRKLASTDISKISRRDEGLAKYGFAYGLIQSDPSLQALFNRAINPKTGIYTAERFEAELRTTDWYKNNSLAKRNYEILRTGDPKEFENKLNQWTSWVTDQARELGASITPDQARSFADQIMSGGLDPNKASQVFSATFIDFNSSDLLGRAGALQDEISTLSRQYGNILNQSQVNNYVQQILTGQTTNSDVLDSMKRIAASTYSNFSDRIMAGETVDEIADPYKRLMQQYLELADVSLNDSLMLDALTGKNEKGGMKYGSLSDFTRAIKSDERWQFTNNARDEYFKIGEKVLSDWGLLG